MRTDLIMLGRYICYVCVYMYVNAHAIIIQPGLKEIPEALKCKNRKGSLIQVLDMPK